MKIPKYIDKALKMRTKAVYMFNHYDYIVSKWIVKNGLENDIDTSCFFWWCRVDCKP